MAAVYHGELQQGSDEWLAARCGLLTASEMHNLVTPTLKIAANDKMRAYLCELVAQRITRFVEPQYVSDAMLRGQEDEIEAVALYAKRFANGERVSSVGFITNDEWGFTIGYSPDALVGEKGLLEVKSRCQRHQVATICAGEVPADYIMQCQTGLLVADDREWLDFVSYSGGLPVIVLRVHPDDEVQAAVIEAAESFEFAAAQRIADFHANVAACRTYPTERRIVQDMII